MKLAERRAVMAAIDELVKHGEADFYVISVRDGEGDIEEEFVSGHQACNWIERQEALGEGPYRIEANGYNRVEGDDRTLYDGFDCPGCATCAGEDSEEDARTKRTYGRLFGTDDVEIIRDGTS